MIQFQNEEKKLFETEDVEGIIFLQYKPHLFDFIVIQHIRYYFNPSIML